tara:strand:+ start:1330 stop:1485 length:156 start_codon:yes stop_codon:yes gene_type:complete
MVLEGKVRVASRGKLGSSKKLTFDSEKKANQKPLTYYLLLEYFMKVINNKE